MLIELMQGLRVAYESRVLRNLSSYEGVTLWRACWPGGLLERWFQGHPLNPLRVWWTLRRLERAGMVSRANAELRGGGTITLYRRLD